MFRVPLHFKEGKVVAAILDKSDIGCTNIIPINNVMIQMHKHYHGTIASVNVTDEFEQIWPNVTTITTNDIAVVKLSKPIPEFYFVPQKIPLDKILLYQNAILKPARLPTENEVISNKSLFFAGYGEGKLKFRFVQLNCDVVNIQMRKEGMDD